MNQLEKRYAELLELSTKVKPQEVAAWRFEQVKLRLAKATFYTPDFKVIRPDGLIEYHEVKGHWEDDARVKIKCAAEMYPEYLFVGVTWDRRKGWQFERFGREE
jgi:hypothetical protein